ncbi:MAG: M20/M25/M40 family metallo-hydrolase [Deinococcales bacterium]
MTASREHDTGRPGDGGQGRSLELLERLVRIDSVNPALVEGAAGEDAIAGFVAAWGEARGMEVTRLEPVAGRPSVVLVARGSGGGESLMLNAHLDTVGVEGMEAPFRPRLEGGRLYGRGALDMKAGLAAAMTALEAASRLELRGDVLLAAVADEEHASLGTEAVLEHFGADGAIVTEPSNLELHLAHRGFAVFELETLGVASHTSQPERGVNAVAHMGHVLAAVEALQKELAAREPHALAGRGSAQVVRIRGGEELFVTPASCRASFERRTVPGETLRTVEGELEALLSLAAAGGEGFRGRAELELLREPFEVDGGARIVRLAREHAGRVLQREPVTAGAPYWTDAALLQAAGIPTLVLGPSGEGLHAADEHVEVASVAALEAILTGVIGAFCA